MNNMAGPWDSKAALLAVMLAISFMLLSTFIIVDDSITFAATANCKGKINLTLDPSSVAPYGLVKPSASGLSDCTGKSIKFRRNSCSGTAVSSCISGSAGCAGPAFIAPAPGTYTYYACINKNNENGFNDPGEKDSKVLTVIGPTTTTTTTSTTTTTLPFDFSVSVNPSSGRTSRLTSTQTNVTVTFVGNTSLPVTLSQSGCPPFTNCSFSPTNKTSLYVFTVRPNGSTPLGIYPIDIIATAGGMVKSTAYRLNVTT